MASTIPYDPTLVLGNLVDPADIENLKVISSAERPVDVAQDTLNDTIRAKQKLQMTYTELANLGLSQEQLTSLDTQITALNDTLAKNAGDYAKAVLDSQKAIADGKTKIATLSEQPESPVDWNKTEIKKIELSSNTMNMDVQYIRNEDEDDGSNAHADNVAASVSAAVSSVFGFKAAASVATNVANTTLLTTTAHNIIGTLVITAACTHKMATELAPFILDPEKAIDAWNQTYPSDIIPSDPTAMAELINVDNKNKLHILSGKTIGSSFVGLVHFEQHENTDSTQNSNASTKAANASFEYGGWFADYEGKFGITKDVSDNVKKMFSTTNVTSHCSLITMGLIPSIKSNLIKTTVNTLKPDAKEVMSQLSAIQGATDSTVKTIGSSASDAKVGSQYIELNNSYITNVVSNLGVIENDNNQVIDTNSLMTAFDDYVQQATKGEDGVPINFFIREITKSAIVKAWMKKFNPRANWQFSSGDDSETGTTKSK
jgi:hypothetical protein